MDRASAGRLTDELAGAVLDNYWIGADPQIDLWVLADALGVQVFERELREDGWMRWMESGPVVCLSVHAGIERRRFTLAHELGHVMLQSERLSLPALLPARRAFLSEEVFCDALAGGLLMPRSWVSRVFRRVPQRLAAIQSLARAAGVSLSAALVRLREIHGWQRTLLQWRAESGGWTYDAEAGVWPSEQNLIRASEGTAWALSDHRRRGCVSCVMELPLCISGEERDISAEVRFAGDRAIVLIDSPARLLAG
jgi:Zn-dependent peptidase ImmA (M78 family)